MFSIRSSPFTSRFLEIATAFPERPALYSRGNLYTYTQLKRYVEVIAKKIGHDIPGETLIGIADQNDVHTYAAAIAVNLLGKTFIPVNTRFPAKKIQAFAQEAGLGFILSSAPFSCEGTGTILLQSCTPGDNDACELPRIVSSLPAYILFTSGTTGSPKGVPIFNHHLNAFFDHFTNPLLFSFSPEDRFLQVYETSFDVSIFSAFMPLFTGACMYLLPRRGFAYLEIPGMMAEQDITVVSMVPSVLHYLQPYFSELRFPKLRYSFFSGDKLYHQIAVGWSACCPHATIFNCYGPTEATIVCTGYQWEHRASAEESFNGIVPVGKIFPGNQMMLISEDGQEAEHGEEGELCLSGSQIIESYLNGVSPGKFFDYPVQGFTQRFYRTGDRMKMSKNDNLLFIGRTDHQMKIGGYRIEGGEVESALTGIRSNGFCAVIPVMNPEGIQVMYAFLEGEGDQDSLLNELRTLLPPHSIPQKIIFLDKMPLNAHGKIDRKELLNFV